jgi:hypothetical protein
MSKLKSSATKIKREDDDRALEEDFCLQIQSNIFCLICWKAVGGLEDKKCQKSLLAKQKWHIYRAFQTYLSVQIKINFREVTNHLQNSLLPI